MLTGLFGSCCHLLHSCKDCRFNLRANLSVRQNVYNAGMWEYHSNDEA